ncbi:hypothetical protein NMY22_g7843 [Coprinellus aureogranulatus]|nr:hypothetical protein NMY22_g7843 [Coprinellus aureogranulatus]
MHSLKFLIVGAAALATMSSARPIGTVNAIAGIELPDLSNLEIPSLVNVDAGVIVEALDKRNCDCTSTDVPFPLPTFTDGQPTSTSSTVVPTSTTTSASTTSTTDESPSPTPKPSPEDPEDPEDGDGDLPVTVPSILLDLDADLGEVLGQIKLAVSTGEDGVGVDLDMDTLNELLSTVQYLLSDSTGDLLDCISNGGLDGLFGALLSPIELCGIMAGLMKTIVTILSTVLSALGGQTDGLGDTLGNVTGLVGDLLTTVTTNVDGLSTVLSPIVATLIPLLSGLGLDCSPITQALKDDVLIALFIVLFPAVSIVLLFCSCEGHVLASTKFTPCHISGLVQWRLDRHTRIQVDSMVLRVPRNDSALTIARCDHGSSFLAPGGHSQQPVDALVSRRKRNPRGLPYVPGPKGQLLIGNLADVPRDQAWVGYHELCQQYGDMIRLNVLGTEILVLDSIQHATALLEKRAVNYSDRPDMAAIHLTDTYWSFALLPYGNAWRQHRRVFHQYFNQSAIPKYHPIVCAERDNFLRKLRDDPKNWVKSLQRFFGTTIMRITYGFEDPDKNAKIIHAVETFVTEFAIITTPGRYLVNTFPALRHVPGWLPGAGWKRYMTGLAKLGRDVRDRPFEEAKTKVKEERGPHPNVAAELIDHLPADNSLERNQAETIARNVCALAYIAGAESSTASGIAMIFALANHPEVQKKAQAELDTVVGPDRLPLVADRPNLPYVHAVVKELGRWYTTTPLSLVHSSSDDDEYEGYFIPKGTLIIPNAWAMMHDPNTFEQPDKFYPERYLREGDIDPSVPDAELAGFGFGRRICPGRYFSNDVLFLYTASILASFDIAPPKDDNGESLKAELKMGNGPIS